MPPLFRAVTAKDADGKEHLCWDGLFAPQPADPRVHQPRARAAQEIWVVRINPLASAQEPVTMPEIIDRRNELSGNLSLDQEIYFIEKINELRLKSPRSRGTSTGTSKSARSSCHSISTIPRSSTAASGISSA